MAYLYGTNPRVGRSQGASIFWGVISVFFAAAACFYFWRNNENEINANKYHGEVQVLQDQVDSLNAQKEKLQASLGDRETQIKAREDLLQDKESKLGDEETRLETLSQQLQNPAQLSQAQTATAKKFAETARKLAKDAGGEVVARGARSVLRLPAAALFAPGDAVLTPDGTALLGQVVLGLGGLGPTLELRVESFTDAEAEIVPPSAGSTEAKPLYATSWDLTGARAQALTHYFHDQATLPFANLLVVARGDTAPVASATKGDHNKSRRVEISLTQAPAPVKLPDAAASPAPAADGAKPK